MTTNTYRVSWHESHLVTALIVADTSEEAINRAKNYESEYIIEFENIDAYGEIIPDTFEVELADDADVQLYSE